MKRIYYDIEETRVTRKKGYIELDTDYTQIYNCFTAISPGIKSVTTFKLLFWLLANKTGEMNGIDCSVNSYREFNEYLKQHCKEGACGIGYRTFTNCMVELKEAGALTRIGKGHYYANPNMFWKDDVDKRTTMLIEEKKDGNYISLNPGSFDKKENTPDDGSVQ
jgi:hypothetical protein